MQELGNTCRVVLQWIPAHCGIPGNEQADQLAKCGAQEEQPSTSIGGLEDPQLTFKQKCVPLHCARCDVVATQTDEGSDVDDRCGNSGVDKHLF